MKFVQQVREYGLANDECTTSEDRSTDIDHSPGNLGFGGPTEPEKAEGNDKYTKGEQGNSKLGAGISIIGACFHARKNQVHELDVEVPLHE